MELSYLYGKGQCGGTICTVIYLNNAYAVRESKYTSLKTHRKLAWVGPVDNRPSTIKLHQYVNKNNLKNVTCDT